MSTQDHHYDVIICGAGSAGLGLAHQLSRQKHALKIALVDSSFSDSENKTWCFWDDTTIPDPNTIHHTWQHLSVQNKNHTVKNSLSDSKYYCIRNTDYRSILLNRIKNDSRFALIEDLASEICEDEKSHNITVSLEKNSDIIGATVFDSTKQSWANLVQPGSNILLQHFEGWEIETQNDCFDPFNAKLMDFRTSQEFGFAFVYVLPFSEKRALIELTYFSEKLVAPSQYPESIKKYLSDHYDLELNDETKNNKTKSGGSYQILNTESGVIPMVDLPFKNTDTVAKFNIGLQSGIAKASTGYAFSRIQRDVSEIATSLIDGNPIKRSRSPFRFRYYDMLMLHIISEHPEKAVQVFMELFRKNGFDTMFKFLDEKTGFLQELKIMASVPSYIDFFKAIGKTIPKIAKL